MIACFVTNTARVSHPVAHTNNAGASPLRLLTLVCHATQPARIRTQRCAGETPAGTRTTWPRHLRTGTRATPAATAVTHQIAPQRPHVVRSTDTHGASHRAARTIVVEVPHDVCAHTQLRHRHGLATAATIATTGHGERHRSPRRRQRGPCCHCCAGSAIFFAAARNLCCWHDSHSILLDFARTANAAVSSCGSNRQATDTRARMDPSRHGGRRSNSAT